MDLNTTNTYLIDLGYSAPINEKCPHFPKRTIEAHRRFPFYDPVVYTGGAATPSTDVYSLGFTLEKLAQGLVKDGVVTDPPLPGVLDLAKSMTDFEPEKRPSMDVVISTLQSLATSLASNKGRKARRKKGAKGRKVQAADPCVELLEKEFSNCKIK